MNPATLIAALTEKLDFGWRSASSAAVTPFFSARALAPALGNHLWQSTLFALAAALLTLTLRQNQARARYWLWFTASLKFFIPFSWLVALGSHLAWWHTQAPPDTSLYYTIEQISQPFTQSANSAITVAPSVAPRSLVPILTTAFPALLAALWLCGFLTVLLTWCLRWRKISAAIRNSVPVRAGRELETLRRLERTTGLRQRIELLLSRSTLEPGIFGMSRPVLLWPEGISQHLETPHLEAVLAHELWHVRRRDNLAAAIHMLVEAVFWFHPLVWWLGARLVDERERACDEEVLELGGEPRIYAESILKVCEFCVGSPLACVSGVTGADLKKRMVHIMSEHVARKLDLSKKLLLTAAGVIAIAAPIVFGLVHATPSRAQSQSDAAAPPRFESFTIAPSQPAEPANPGEKHMTKMMFGPDKGFVASNITLQSVIQDAYGVQANQIIGAPDWLNTERFDIEGKVSPSQTGDATPFILHGPDAAKVALDTAGGVNKMLQAALADHTKLVVHTETKILPTYVLVVAEGGSKLQPAPAEDTDENANSKFGPRMINGVRLKINDKQDSAHVMDLEAHGMSADDLAGHLARELGQPVINKTGLTGRYNFELHFTKDAAQPGSSDASTDSSSADSPSLFTAVQEQLGLKLEPQKAPTQVLVIDHIDKPTTEQAESEN